MNKKLESVKFNLTEDMSLELLKFNELKKKKNELEKLYNLERNKEILLQIKELEIKLKNSRNKFIKEFRRNNSDEIIKYLKLKDYK